MINKHQAPKKLIDEDTKETNKPDAVKLNLKHILLLTEEITNPISLIGWNSKSDSNNQTSLLVDGLAPDIAWKLQTLLDGWHSNDPLLFPKIKLQIYNMRLQYIDKELPILFDFFKDRLQFDRILSLKGLFNQEEREQLYADEIAITIFRNTIEIYLRRNMKGLDNISFSQPTDYTKNDYAMLSSDHDALDSIVEIIKPKLVKIFNSIYTKAEEMGFDNEISSKMRNNINNNFSIDPLISLDESIYLQEKVEDLFLRKILPTEITPDKIKNDFDVLHYLRFVSNSNISIAELLTTTTKFIHDESSLENEAYILAKFSVKPIVQTMYLLHNLEKFHIRILDLSNIRLLRQPNMEVLSRLKHMNTLILDNGRASNEFDITKLEFGKLPQLEILSLRNCGLKTLKKEMFAGCANLKRLYVTENTFNQIDDDCFVDIALDELYIDMSDEIKLPEPIIKLLEKTGVNNKLRHKQLIDAITDNSIE